MISTVFKTTALADEVELLFVASLRGEIRTDGKGSAPMHIGSKQTPISRGLSEGYSKEDIAYFYIARELGNNWSEKILENLSEEFRSKINTAFNAFREDVNIEKSSVRKQPLDIPF